MSKSKILFIMTGSIACYKACQLLSSLKQADFELKVVLTKSAQQFIGHATIEGLVGDAVYTDTFAAHEMMNHIHLARWADLIIVTPASANFINKIATGIGDDLASTLFLTHDFTKPFLLAPAMNTKMYLHPITQKSLKHLSSIGVKILETASGVLACGEVGWGKLLDPVLIQEEIVQALKLNPRSATRPPKEAIQAHKVLITYGGTSEPIDQVRSIQNMSKGDTGSFLADYMGLNGFEVDVIRSKNSKKSSFQNSESIFFTFQDLERQLEQKLKENFYDVVIHCAAVSDYHVDSIQGEDGKTVSSSEKISSNHSNLQIRLKRNPKLLPLISEWSKNQSASVVAFKLVTDSHDQAQAVQKLTAKSKLDWVVANVLGEISESSHPFEIYDAQSCSIAKGQTKSEMGLNLVDLIYKKMEKAL